MWGRFLPHFITLVALSAHHFMILTALFAPQIVKVGALSAPTQDMLLKYSLDLPYIQIPVDISHILGNLITVIFDYQILRKPLKILSL